MRASTGGHPLLHDVRAHGQGQRAGRADGLRVTVVPQHHDAANERRAVRRHVQRPGTVENRCRLARNTDQPTSCFCAQ